MDKGKVSSYRILLFSAYSSSKSRSLGYYGLYSSPTHVDTLLLLLLLLHLKSSTEQSACSESMTQK